MFKETHPIIGTRDVRRAMAFYTQQLGFRIAFGAASEQPDAEHPNYVGYRRDAVEVHMQFQYEDEMGTVRLCFLIDDPDVLFAEYRERGVPCRGEGACDTSWGTREFTCHDPDGNALTFYRDLTPSESGC